MPSVPDPALRRGLPWSLRFALLREWGLLLIAALALVAVMNAWTPSSYGSATRILAMARSGPVLGDAQLVRSDEWAVQTPYFQIAVANDLGPRNEASLYKEPLKAFFALPSRDWSMAFKPDLWGFLVLDPAHAYALHYAALALAMVAGVVILLRQLGCAPGYSLAISLLLFSSQFVQAWWTSNAPVLALAVWPAIAFLWKGPWWARLPLIAYAVAVWLIGLLYPPFILSAALALAILIAAFRPEALRPSSLIPGVAAGCVGAAIAWAHFADLIPVMAATVYPGHRVSNGGGVPLLQLAAQVFPSLVTMRTEPLPLRPTNACEVAVVGSFLPLAMACFCDHRSIGRWFADHRAAAGICIGGLGLMLAWMVLPWPAALAPGLNLAPPGRMLWGFGLLLLLGLALIGARLRWRLTPLRLAIFTAAVLGGWAISKRLLSSPDLALGRFDVAILPVLAALLLIGRFAPGRLPPRRLVLAATVITALVTFGRFNPVQSAKPIFEPRPSLVLDALRAYAGDNPHGVAVETRHYGAVIVGAGVPALNHVLLQPQLAVFRQAYPGLDPASFDQVFNRYAHIKPEVRWAPAVLNADLIAAPPDPFAIPTRVTIVPVPRGAPGAGAIERVEAVDLGAGRIGVVVEGWAPWSGVDAGQGLEVALADPQAGRIVRATAFRLARPDIVAARNSPAAYAAGFGLRLEIERPSGLPFSASDLRVAAIEPGARAALIGP